MNRTPRIVIDARPRIGWGLVASAIVSSRPAIDHVVDLALGLAEPGAPIEVYARPEDHAEISSLIRPTAHDRIRLLSGSPRADAVVLRTDRIYEPRRLRREVSRGGAPEAAVTWRLDRPEAIATADEELLRRRVYQPLGRFWAFPLAHRLAESLRETRVRPNALTLAAASLMLGGSACLVVAGPFPWANAAIAFAFAAALVLDTADGHLARLQGTASPFGRWLDQVLDEWADLSLHAAIAWAAFVQTDQPAWLAVGIAYAAGKYLFLFQSHAGSELEAAIRLSVEPGQEIAPSSFHSASTGSRATVPALKAEATRNRGLAALVRLVGHADIRWHLWIVLAAVGRLDLALAVYAVYFPMRAAAGFLRKVVIHAVA
jgi:hypothetical protein